MIDLKEDKIDSIDTWYVSNMFESEMSFTHIKDSWVHFHKSQILEHVKNRGTVVQAGGWQGMYPALLSYMFDQVYTFEPHPVNFKCLSLNCVKPNVQKFKMGLSNESQSSVLEETMSTGQHRIIDHSGPMFELQTTGNSYNVDMITIDSLKLDACDFIMLDCENYERYILLGARDTIIKYRPVISIEKSYFESHNIFYKEFLSMFGYKLVGEYIQDLYFKV